MNELKIYRHVSFFAVIWICCSGLYLTKVTAFSPVYIAFFLCFFNMCFSFLFIQRIGISRYSFACIILSLFSLFLLLNTKLNLVANVIISFLSPVLVGHFFKWRTISIKLLLFVFFIYAFVFVFDGVWRVQHPYIEHIDKLESLGIGFQIYKMNSLMYLDSNYVGIESVFILSVFLYLFRDCSLRGALLISYGGVLVSLLVGVALTFSRSAYLAVTLLILMNFIFRSRILTSLSFFLVPLIFLILTYLISTEYSHDLSFESKFRILSYAYDYISSANVSSILLGVGLGNSVDVIGIGSHNLIITFLIETGVIGLLLFLIMLSWVCLSLKSDALLVVLPFFIASMSLGTTALPYFFTFSYLCILYKKNQFTIS